MPSYYDSSKKKPGKAEVKYKKGGKVKYAEGGSVKPKSESELLREQKLRENKSAIIQEHKKALKNSPAKAKRRPKKQKYAEGGVTTGLKGYGSGKTTIRERARRKLLPTAEERIQDSERRSLENIERSERNQERREKDSKQAQVRGLSRWAEDLERYTTRRGKHVRRVTGQIKERDARKSQAEAAQERMRRAREEAQERVDLRQNKAKGGLVRVRGMGSATRGGNFTRNG
jgi:hypothetical protein